MKRTLSIILISVLMLLLLAACGSEPEQAETASVDLQAVMTDINSKYGISDLKTVDGVSSLHRYYRVEESDVKQFAAEHTATSSAYTEIILIEGVDETAAGRIKALLDDHLRKQLSDAKSYHADQVSMIESCEAVEDGCFVYLIISDQYDAIVGTIEEALQQ